MIGAVGSGANGHCIALNNIRTYLTTSNHMERSKFLVDFSNNDNENIISSEGCFACDMNKANKSNNSFEPFHFNNVRFAAFCDLM